MVFRSGECFGKALRISGRSKESGLLKAVIKCIPRISRRSKTTMTVGNGSGSVLPYMLIDFVQTVDPATTRSC
jgi:hypothetical protein